MKKAVSIMLGLCLAQYVLLAQSRILSGKVIGKPERRGLAGVSIQYGKYQGTVTDSKGNFKVIIDQNKKHALIASFIGYKNIIIPVTESENYLIELEKAELELDEVIISGKARTILERAISRIPDNYRTDSFILNGIARVQNIVNESDYFYRSDGIISIYYPPYSIERPDLKVKLLQNRDTIIQDRKSKSYNSFKRLKWVGGFHTISDFVFRRSFGLKLNALDKYGYHQRPDSVVENRSVFVIDFFSKSKAKVEGTFYIDKSTYAFVAIRSAMYNVQKFGYLQKSYVERNVVYQPLYGKWYVKTASYKGLSEFTGHNIYLSDFVFTSLDTIDVKPFRYKDIIQETDDNILTKKTGDSAKWIAVDSLLKDASFAQVLNKVELPVLPVDRLNNNLESPRKKFVDQLRDYVNGNNIQGQIGFGKMPVSLAKAQPSINKNIGIIHNYSFGWGMIFRLKKELFFHMSAGSNYGLGGISNANTSYQFLYHFLINKNYHPLKISPVVGYNKIRFNQRRTNYYVRHAAFAGFQLGYEINRRYELVTSVNYHGIAHVKNNSGLSVDRKSNFAHFIGIGMNL